ncbi:hypothetical protein M2397_001619 [Pseudomonas sp. BIGb0381]|nr:hypothetical protein [Pseudomonas sp. BIGb0381]
MVLLSREGCAVLGRFSGKFLVTAVWVGLVGSVGLLLLLLLLLLLRAVQARSQQ